MAKKLHSFYYSNNARSIELWDNDPSDPTNQFVFKPASTMVPDGANTVIVDFISLVSGASEKTRIAYELDAKAAAPLDGNEMKYDSYRLISPGKAELDLDTGRLNIIEPMKISLLPEDESEHKSFDVKEWMSGESVPELGTDSEAPQHILGGPDAISAPEKTPDLKPQDNTPHEASGADVEPTPVSEIEGTKKVQSIKSEPKKAESSKQQESPKQDIKEPVKRKRTPRKRRSAESAQESSAIAARPNVWESFSSPDTSEAVFFQKVFMNQVFLPLENREVNALKSGYDNIESVKELGNGVFVVKTRSNEGLPDGQELRERSAFLMNSDGKVLAQGRDVLEFSPGTPIGAGERDVPLWITDREKNSFVLVQDDSRWRDIEMMDDGRLVGTGSYEAPDSFGQDFFILNPALESNGFDSINRIGKDLYVLSGKNGSQLFSSSGNPVSDKFENIELYSGNPNGEDIGIYLRSPGDDNVQYMNLNTETQSLHRTPVINTGGVELMSPPFISVSRPNIGPLEQGALMRFAEREYNYQRDVAMAGYLVDGDADQYRWKWDALSEADKNAYANSDAVRADFSALVMADVDTNNPIRRGGRLSEAEEKIANVQWLNLRLRDVRNHMFLDGRIEENASFPDFYSPEAKEGEYGRLRDRLLAEARAILAPLNDTRERRRQIDAIRRENVDRQDDLLAGEKQDESPVVEEVQKDLVEEVPQSPIEPQNETPENLTTDKQPSDEAIAAMNSRFAALKAGSDQVADNTIDGFIASEPKTVGDKVVFDMRIPDESGEDPNYVSVMMSKDAFEKNGAHKVEDPIAIKGALIKEDRGKGATQRPVMVGSEIGKSMVFQGRWTPQRVATALLWKLPVTLIRSAIKGAWWGLKALWSLAPSLLGCLTIIGIPKFIGNLIRVLSEGLAGLPNGIMTSIPGKHYGSAKAAAVKANNEKLLQLAKNAPVIKSKPESPSQKDGMAQKSDKRRERQPRKRNDKSVEKTQEKEPLNTGQKQEQTTGSKPAVDQATEKKESVETPVKQASAKVRSFNEAGNDMTKEISPNFKDIVGEMSNGKYVCILADGKHVYADEHLKPIGKGYDGLVPFGTTALGENFGVAMCEGGKLAILDAQGNEKVGGLNAIKEPVNGFSVIKTTEGNKEVESFLDLNNGCARIPGNFQKCYPFDPSTGTARVVQLDGKENLLRKDGNTISETGFNKLIGYYGELPVVENLKGEPVFLSPDGKIEYKQAFGVNADEVATTRKPTPVEEPIKDQPKEIKPAEKPKKVREDLLSKNARTKIDGKRIEGPHI